MLDGNNFKDEDAAIRAVHLIQYITSAQTETPEHLLAFNKILCGLPLDVPVPLSVEMTEEEKELVAQLLNSVLANWEKMKNATVENLRGSFLLREGRLVEEPKRWRLTVEPKGYDIILDYLPLTISVIKLPWMKKGIEVDWRTKA